MEVARILVNRIAVSELASSVYANLPNTETSAELVNGTRFLPHIPFGIYVLKVY